MKFSSMVPSQDFLDKSGLGAPDFEVAVSAVSNSKNEKRKPYRKWSSQEMFTIGKCAAINGPAPSAKTFGLKGRSVNESTTREFCAMYKAELKKSRKEKTSHCAKSNLPRGRPLLLRSLNEMVQMLLLALQSRGGLITSVIVVSVAKALIARNPHLMLDHIDLDPSSWAKSLFYRMGFKKTHENNWQHRNPQWSKERGPTFVFTRYCISG